MGTLTEYLRFVVTLTAVVDPFLAVPFFLQFTRADVAHQFAVIGCIALVCLVSWAALSRAHAIAQRLSLSGLNIATRILGLLLAAMAVQTMAEGLKELLPGLAS